MTYTINTSDKTIQIIEPISTTEAIELLKTYPDYQLVPYIAPINYPITYPYTPSYSIPSSGDVFVNS